MAHDEGLRPGWEEEGPPATTTMGGGLEGGGERRSCVWMGGGVEIYIKLIMTILSFLMDGWIFFLYYILPNGSIVHHKRPVNINWWLAYLLL
jgi:hypothetical protein